MKQQLKQPRKHLLLIGCTILLLACKNNSVNPGTSSNSSILSVPDAPTQIKSQAPNNTTSSETLTYDLQSDWSDIENPNGVWSLNTGDTPLVPVQHLSATGISGFNTPQPGFTPQPILGNISPIWFRSTGPFDDFETGDIVTHTSQAHEPNSNVTWTSNIDGIVDITGNVWTTQASHRTNDWFIYLNDELKTSGTLSPGDPFERETPFLFEDGSGGSAALKSLAVSIGDIVKLEFEQKFGFGEDFVGVNFTVTVVGPRTKDDCKKGGWEQFGFKNQGQCIRFVVTGKDSR